jgi:DNA polymerase-3 subunit beta
MKFTVNQVEFNSALQRVAPSAAVKTTVPVLANVLIEAGAGGLTLTASDFTARAVATVGADVKEPGAITVPAKGLLNRVGNLDGSVAASLIQDRFTIKSGHRKYTLEVLPAETYPVKAGQGGETVDVELQAGVLFDLLGKTLYAADTNPDKPNLCCVNVASHERGLRAFAIDGHRFSVAYAPDKTPAFGLTVPQIRAREIVKLLYGVPGNVKLHISRQSLTIDFPWGEFSTALPNVAPVNIDQVLNQRPADATAQIPRKSSLDSIKALLCALDEHSGLEIQLSNGTMNLKTATGDDKVPAEYTGEPQSARVNINYIVQALSAVDDAEVNLSMPEFGGMANGIIMLRPAVGDSWVAGCMPLRK